MDNINKAIDRIKILQCPTGELENRVIGILEDYKVASKDEISIDRNEHIDKDEALGYTINIPDNRQISLLARSGIDDYIVSVVDALEG